MIVDIALGILLAVVLFYVAIFSLAGIIAILTNRKALATCFLAACLIAWVVFSH